MYWKRKINEAGWDLKDMARLSENRERWKARVEERMKHLYEWENQKQHRYIWGKKRRGFGRTVRG